MSPFGTSRRKSVMSNPCEQCKIVSLFVLVAAAFIATQSYVSKSALRSMHDESLDNVSTRLAESVETEAVNDVRRDLTTLYEQHNDDLTLQLALFGVLSAVILALGAVAFSHKMAGPIHQLTVYCRDAARGAVAPRAIRFRKYDFFAELAEAFNEFQRGKGVLPPEAGPSKPPERAG